jgi:hypothetical protein
MRGEVLERAMCWFGEDSKGFGFIEVDMVMAKVMDACMIQCLDFEKILNTSQKVHAWIDQRGW